VLAISSKLEAPTFTLPRGSGLRHFVGLVLAALDLDGLCGLVGVVGIPILSGFGAPAKELFDVFAGCSGIHFNRYAARTCIGLAGHWRKPHSGRPRNDVPIIRRSLERHTL
jgi:hypothetical protein